MSVLQVSEFASKITSSIMQTFLPYPSFTKSASVLDRQRLGKQRVEGLQILQCLLGVGSQRWQHHPAVKMWKGHECILAWYVMIICEEWQQRGYLDSVKQKVKALITKHDLTANIVVPPWLGNRRFHATHKAMLLKKDLVHYRQYFKTQKGPCAYYWPVK